MSQRVDILAHRGLWSSRSEMNSLRALSAAVDEGFGLEFDLRDFKGELVVSHDPPRSKGLTFRRLLEKISSKVRENDLTLAINIKSDGLENPTARLIENYSLSENCFVFDMSVPSMLQFLRLQDKYGVRVAARISEFEGDPVLADDCEFFWVDCFKKDWIPGAVPGDRGLRRKTPIFVSPELHGRSHRAAWSKLKGMKRRFGLCTDHPQDARKFFSRFRTSGAAA
jgi:hypothetical protein